MSDHDFKGDPLNLTPSISATASHKHQHTIEGHDILPLRDPQTGFLLTWALFERRSCKGSPVMCTLPEPAKSMRPMLREKKTLGLLVPHANLNGDSQPCKM